MGKKNDFLARLGRQRAFDDAVIRTVTQRYVLDMVVVALGRLGWARSAVRFEQFNKTMAEVTKEYAALAAEDKRDDPEFTYMKYRLDKEIAAVVGDKFVPDDVRYRINEDDLKANL